MEYKETDNIIKQDGGIKYRLTGFGWTGDVYVEILPIADGVWFLYINFGYSAPEVLSTGNSDAGDSEFVSNIQFGHREDDQQMLDVAFAFPEDGMFVGQMVSRDLYNGTFYTYSAHDRLHQKAEEERTETLETFKFGVQI